MWSPKLSWSLVVIGILGRLGTNAEADDGLPSMGFSSFLPVQATLRHEAIVGDEQIRRTYVTVGTNLFAFCVPPGFQLDASNPAKVVLTPADYKCFLVFRVRARDLEGVAKSYRDTVLEEYPDAKILSEFAQPAGTSGGEAFDLQWVSTGHIIQSARVVFVESSVGTVELILLASADNFAGSKRALDYLRFSYCSDKDGPIKPLQTPSEPPRS